MGRIKKVLDQIKKESIVEEDSNSFGKAYTVKVTDPETNKWWITTYYCPNKAEVEKLLRLDYKGKGYGWRFI